MPALPPAVGVIKIVEELGIGPDAHAINRFFVNYSGTPPTDAQLNTYAGAISTSWGSHIAPLCSNDVSLLAVDCEDLSSSTGAVGRHSGIVSGSRTGSPLPPAACAVIREAINRRYRGGKPKVFLPGGVAADIAGGGVWSGTFATAVAGGWGTHINDIEGAGWAGAGTIIPVSVSYYAGFTVVVSGTTGRARNVPTRRVTPVQDAITGYTCDTLIGSQRRRNGR